MSKRTDKPNTSGEQAGTKPTKVEVVDQTAGKGARPVNSVKGRVVSDVVRDVVIEGSQPQAAEGQEVLLKCSACRQEFAESEWDDNGGDCPACDAMAGQSPPDEESPQLSEAELLFETIGEERSVDEYVIRVDHLPEYYVEGSGNKGKSNTTAPREFCRFLRGGEVTLDFMETVRRSCNCPILASGERGRFLFTASKSQGGFIKRWPETITKALPEEKATGPSTSPVPQVATAAAAAQLPKSSKEELRESVELVKELYTIMAPTRQQPQPALPPADPFDSAKATITLVKDITEMMGTTSAGGSEGEHWSVGIVRSLRLGDVLVEGFKAVPQLLAYAANKQNVNGNGAAAPAPTSEAGSVQGALPASGEATAPQPPTPEEMAALEVVVVELRGFNDDEDREQLEERVGRAVVAMQALPLPAVMQILPAPTAFLLGHLSTLKPEWADLANMSDAIGFLNELKEALMAMVMAGTFAQPQPATAAETPAGEQGTGEVVTFLPLAAVDNEQQPEEKKDAKDKPAAKAANKGTGSKS